MTAPELHHRIRDLQAERAATVLEGLDRDADYMADLRDELAACEAAYVGAAVTEIASLRARLCGRLAG